ncbi:alpha/beta fold hydrolase [Kocuria sp. CPCC 205300]|uniref:alpha/beta fold hydrolase n=1 Tax=Kocuria sabuli TaxID=3071448 RepID=UPI0036DE1221
MTGWEWRPVDLPDTTLEVAVRGSGEPVVVIQTAQIADEFVPLASRPELHGHRVVLYHRRGYAGSSPVRGPGSIERDALDCRRLLDALGLDRVHLVGGSYSAAVALQLAADAPERVHSLTLIEPPPTITAGADAFREAARRFVEIHRTQGPAAALEEFATRIMDPDWRTQLERHLPGGSVQVQRDAETLFGTDMPALVDWRFGAVDARRIRGPVLHVGGAASGPLFAAVREQILAWFPGASDVVVTDADHMLAITHPAEVASGLATFLRAHPLEASSRP